MRIKDEVGSKYGRLTVLSRAGSVRGHAAWLCQCICGEQSIVTGVHLRNNNTKSCGCLSREQPPTRATSHGLKTHPLYCVWVHMKDRLFNPHSKDFHNYGGRGISVCEGWLKFLPFYTWAKDKWRPGLELDREDNDGNYEPDNCRFVSPSINSINKRKLRRNTSGYVGVSYNKTKNTYQSYLGCKNLGGNHYLGSFPTAEEACLARNAFILKHNLPHKIQEIK